MARTVDWDDSNTVESGSTTFDSVTGTYTLTEDTAWQSGLITSDTSYSLSYDFTFTFESFFGFNDAGADGLTWLFHNDPDGSNVAAGTGGENLGTMGIENALALEYDTYQNPSDGTASDHIQMRGQTDAGGGFQSDYFESPEIPLGGGNIEDGAWHTNTITWQAATNTLSVWFDGALIGQVVFDAGDANGDGFSEDDLTTVLGGADRVYFSLGGATGGSSNLQEVRAVQMSATVCFTRGTRILTPGGEVPIQRLSEGDLVTVLSGEARPIRWIGHSSVTAQGALAPIRFASGTIGNRRPLMVSPQHRIYLSGWQAELFLGLDHCLVPAFGLINDRSVRRIADQREVEYWHIMLDRHEVIFAEGAPAETLLPGTMAMAALSPEQRAEILAIFPELETRGPGPALACVPNHLAHAFSLPHRHR